MAQQVRIKSVRKSKDAEGGYLYEIQPVDFDGPWELPQGTLLEVASACEGDAPDGDDR